MVDWPGLGPSVLNSLKLVFKTPVQLDAAFDDSVPVLN